MSFIPGMTGAVSATGALTPLTLTSVEKFQHALSHQAAEVAYPTGHRKGDVVVLYDWKYVEDNGGNPSAVVPSGFTSLVNQTGNSGEVDPPDLGKTRVILSYRILDGSEEPAGLITGMGTGNRQVGKMALLFRGNIPIKSVTLKSLSVVVSTTGYDDKTITASTGTKPLVAFAFGAVNSSTQVGFIKNTPAFQETIGNANDMLCGYSCYPLSSTPVNHVIDVFTNVGGSNNYGPNLVCGYLEMA